MSRRRLGLLSILPWLLLAAAAHAEEWDPWRHLEERAAAADSLDAAGPEIRDPFFAFCLAMIESDSLGVWTTDDLAAYAASLGRRSRLPLDVVRSIARSAARPDEVQGDWTARMDRIWRLELGEDLALPLPYSILGYHPGTLHVSRLIEAGEWTFAATSLLLPAAEPPRRFRVYGVAALRIETGHFVLDVDGWLDRLLGKKLDDTWVEAFVLGRAAGTEDPEERGLQGIALGRSRQGRPLSGAFDFRRDEVLPNGLPVARALAAYCRRVVAPVDEPSPRAWSWRP
jgi:hypothetical protein